MFLIESLWLVTIIFLTSTIIGGIIFSAPQEATLPPIIKTSVGFFLSTMFFASVWQITTVPMVWMMGICVCALYAYGKLGTGVIPSLISNIRQHSKSNFRLYLLVMASSLVFFAPNIVGNSYGPFTEGGGDVSIYADVSKLLTDKNLTEYGNEGGPKEIVSNISEVFAMNLGPEGMNQVRAKRYKEIDPEAFNANHGDGAAHRIIASQLMSAFLYAPFGQYNFLAGTNNYAVYFAIQAFLYGIMLTAMWTFCNPYGKLAAWLGVGMAMLSHGLISVLYNMYAAQTYAIAFSIFAVAAVPFCQRSGWRTLKIYLPGLAYIWATYVHFLSVLAPVALGSVVYGLLDHKRSVDVDNSVLKPSTTQRAALWFAISIFSCAAFLLVIGSSGNSINFFKSLFSSIFTGINNVYMGEQLSFFNWKSLSFLFGILSQQHYSPFAIEYDWLNYLIITNIGLGVLLITLGLTAVATSLSKGFSNPVKKELLLYGILLFTIIPHVYLTRMSLYTQAKGCQNVILFLYCAMLLPLFMQRKAAGQQYRFEPHLNRALQVCAVLFCILLILPRAVYGAKIAFEFDRAGILSQSYFDAAKKVNDEDDQPFVLFEPRKSADLYINDQAFFKAKTVPTRHLVLQQLTVGAGSSYRVTVSDLLEGQDIDHVWTIQSQRKDVIPVLGIYNHVWKAERLSNKTDFSLVFAGDSFEQNYGERKIRHSEEKLGLSSYVRNGLALLYIPKNKTGKLKIAYEPRDEKDNGEMAQEIKKRAANGEYGLNFNILQDGRFVILTADVQEHDKNRLLKIARFSGECWININMDGRDL